MVWRFKDLGRVTRLALRITDFSQLFTADCDPDGDPDGDPNGDVINA